MIWRNAKIEEKSVLKSCMTDAADIIAKKDALIASARRWLRTNATVGRFSEKIARQSLFHGVFSNIINQLNLNITQLSTIPQHQLSITCGLCKHHMLLEVANLIAVYLEATPQPMRCVRGLRPQYEIEGSRKSCRIIGCF